MSVNVVAYDSTEPLTGNRIPWAAWARLQIPRGYKVIAARSWDHMIDCLSDKVDTLQYWGHGLPAAPMLNGRTIEGSHLKRLRLWMPRLVWFRCCSVFFGQKGKDFARHATQTIGCKVASHTRIIGVWQSGLQVATPGVEPDWPTDTGNWRDYKSSRTAPRTISCMRVGLPEWAGKDEGWNSQLKNGG